MALQAPHGPSERSSPLLHRRAVDIVLVVAAAVLVIIAVRHRFIGIAEFGGDRGVSVVVKACSSQIPAARAADNLHLNCRNFLSGQIDSQLFAANTVSIKLHA